MGGVLGVFSSRGTRVKKKDMSALAEAASYRGELLLMEEDYEDCSVLLGVQKPEIQRGPFEVDLLTEFGITIAWYGFLFNTQEIKANLVDQSSSAATAQLVLDVYRKWGAEGFSRLEGRFSCAIWDGNRKELLLLIDPIGIKTLNYSYRDGCLTFASEAGQLRALPEHNSSLSELAISMWACNAYDQKISMWEDIHGIGPGCYLKCSHKGVQTESYWSWKFKGYVHFEKQDDYADYFREQLFKSIECYLPAGQNAASYLSGGLDSTSIAAAVSQVLKKRNQRLNTFTYSFPTLKSCDESNMARETAEFMGAKPSFVNAESYWLYKDRLNGVARENPFISWNTLDKELFREVKKRKAHVLFTGHGGDNLFTGTLMPYFVADQMMLRPLSYWSEFKKTAGENHLSKAQAFYRFLLSPLLPNAVKKSARQVFGRTPRKPKWLNEHVYRQYGLRDTCFADHPGLSTSPFEQKRREYALSEHWGILRAAHYLEKLAAPFGIEVAHPWLDTRMIECILSIPPTVFFHELRPKYFIRSAMKGYLPGSVLQRFSKPLLQSFYYYGCKKEEAFIRGNLENGWLEQSGWVEPGQFQSMLDSYYDKGEEALASFVFPLNLELWLQQNHAL